jgi:hypothetical protein
MAERQILLNPVNVGRCQNRRPSQRPPPFWTLALAQVAPAGPAKEDLPVGSYFETFGY